MCLHPIQVTRKVANKVLNDVVPCGKCSECLSKRRSEVALLACLEGASFSSLSYFTLTYNAENLPFAFSEVLDGTCRICGFSRGYPLSSEVLCQPILDSAGFVFCPTVYNEDWKAHLHRFRAWCKRFSKPLDFSFIQFSEYGELRHRPHYHCIVFGFDEEMDAKFSELWQKYFGLVHLDRVNRFNDDGSDAFIKISKYISKYISKGEHLPSFVLDGFALKPRRISSVGFGRKNLDKERLRSFT